MFHCWERIHWQWFLDCWDWFWVICRIGGRVWWFGGEVCLLSIIWCELMCLMCCFWEYGFGIVGTFVWCLIWVYWFLRGRVMICLWGIFWYWRFILVLFFLMINLRRNYSNQLNSWISLRSINYLLLLICYKYNPNRYSAYFFIY